MHHAWIMNLDKFLLDRVISWKYCELSNAIPSANIHP